MWRMYDELLYKNSLKRKKKTFKPSTFFLTDSKCGITQEPCFMKLCGNRDKNCMESNGKSSPKATSRKTRFLEPKSKELNLVNQRLASKPISPRIFVWRKGTVQVAVYSCQNRQYPDYLQVIITLEIKILIQVEIITWNAINLTRKLIGGKSNHNISFKVTSRQQLRRIRKTLTKLRNPETIITKQSHSRTEEVDHKISHHNLLVVIP